MIRSDLATAAKVIRGRVQGDPVAFRGLSTDSRNVERGSLFIALRGPRFDGNRYVADALAQGAVAALVDRAQPDTGPLLLVDDSRRALGALGRWWREQVAPALVGVTGSNGKTTVKQMLTGILSGVGRTSATRGNLNNEIGVPLTLARLREDDAFAVVEMGANHVGEIAYLASLARPDVAVVTNARAAHLEGFGSLEQVARGKGELFESLAPDGVAVINADDPFAALWLQLADGRPVLDFGIDSPARIRGTMLDNAGRCRISLAGESLEITLPVPGRHNLHNALAAAAAAQALRVPAAAIAAGLESFEPPERRLRLRDATGGARLLDDSYNANPASLEAGVGVLVAMPEEPWLALGDMAELGEQAAELHFEAGRMARDHGVRRLYGFGPLSAHAVRGFGQGARHFAELEDLVAALEQDLTRGVALLVKGSRSMGMEIVVERLCRPGMEGA